ncbi:Serine/threonine-protein kinase PrkC [Maioricimonas rarisocia]|uniref:non-specific serine/threonine protein kinase n=1 Tax=Maioricimonas rarisocia TaxID=2528026 RepID=A0A517Z932_9PLAN|nr:bifunctional serine/threonine-protein kinase/formylglycine-generating enzyme family protein [Maioricimonas rarisocia]QDU38984.1 Serine/threonine-protein kinase PrkC [Maioricimonas rarisocia]
MQEREIVRKALEITDPADRASFLDQACGTNATLREQVEQSLKADRDSGDPPPTIDSPGSESGDETTVLAPSEEAALTSSDDGSTEDELRRYLEPTNRPGRLGRLAHYEIEAILGRGAYGIVAKAFDEKLHRVVAIKMLSPELATTSPPRKRFLREARSAAAVPHENLVGIFAVEDEPLPYLVMEYIPGGTLQARLDRNGPLDVPEVLRIGEQVAAGLAAAHAANLIHRDIKPSNILLAEGSHERAKIADFGLARAVDDASMTTSGMIAGTPMYMAPEQARGETLDHRTDLFSLGSVLYQMASGRPPFRAPNTMAVLKRVCEDRPRPLHDVIPEIPGWLEAIIFRLLEKDREDRYQSAQEVADLLARCRNELEHHGNVTCVEQRGQGTQQPTSPARSASSRPSPTKHWLISTAAATLAIVAVLFYVNRDTSDRDASGATSEVAGTTEGAADAITSSAAEGWHGWPADAPPPAIAPFDAGQAKTHQDAWAEYLDVPAEYENSLGMTLRLIPPGEFLMGSTQEEIEEALEIAGEDSSWRERILSAVPQHRVILTQPFYLAATEVTQAQYEQMMGKNPSHFSATGEGSEEVADLETRNHPVEMVSWRDAAEFCTTLSKQEELKPSYIRSGRLVKPLDGMGYRFPTEAEWEFACRAGTTTCFWSGDRKPTLLQVGWNANNSGGRTHAVAELRVNPFGLYDMHGNVWEWVQDTWDAEFYASFEGGAAIDPDNEFQAGARRVVRGGCWFFGEGLCGSSYRHTAFPMGFKNTLGFRVALPVDAVRQLMDGEGMQTPQTEARSWHGWPADAPAPAIAPFDAGQAKAHQDAWAEYLGVPVEYENSLGMTLRLIPPGEFLMGSTQEEIEALLMVPDEDEGWHELVRSEAPQHKVILTQPVYVGVTEVTQAQYEQVMGTNPSHFSPAGEGREKVAGLETGNHPVEMVSWNDAAEFCAKLSEQEQLKPFYFRSGDTLTLLEGSGYRLPTEAEWEYACRAGTMTRFWSGDEDHDVVSASWYGSNSGSRTHAAGELKANPFGLSDVHGNVWECVQDSWDPAFYGKFEEDAAIDPFSPFFGGSRRVLRGGGWGHLPSSCRSSSRRASPSSYRANGIGFRVALPVDAVRQLVN